MCENQPEPNGRVLGAGEQGDLHQADAHTLITLLHLRDLRERNGYTFSIVSEMLDTRNRALAQVTRADDFVVSLRDASGWYRSFSRDRVKVELQDPLAAHRELLDKLTQADVHNLFAYLASLK